MMTLTDEEYRNNAMTGLLAMNLGPIKVVNNDGEAIFYLVWDESESSFEILSPSGYKRKFP